MSQPLNTGRGAGSPGIWRFGRGSFLARYPGGFTVRVALLGTVIVRWIGYVPAEFPGWRWRVGRVEIHARRMA